MSFNVTNGTIPGTTVLSFYQYQPTQGVYIAACVVFGIQVG